MLPQTLEDRAMSFDGPILFGDFLSHGDRNVPGAESIVAYSTELLAHQTIGAGVDDLFELACDRIEPVKDALRHEPAGLWRESLEAIKFIRRAFALRARKILH